MIPYYILLYYTILYHIILYYIISYYIILYHIILYFTILYIILYYIIPYKYILCVKLNTRNIKMQVKKKNMSRERTTSCKWQMTNNKYFCDLSASYMVFFTQAPCIHCRLFSVLNQTWTTLSLSRNTLNVIRCPKSTLSTLNFRKKMCEFQMFQSSSHLGR